MKSLEYGCFEWCSSLKKVVIKGNIREIPDGCFDNCVELKEVIIPSSVMHIGRAFEWCTKLTDIYFEGTKSQWERVNCPYIGTDVAATVVHCKDGDIKLEKGY